MIINTLLFQPRKLAFYIQDYQYPEIQLAARHKNSRDLMPISQPIPKGTYHFIELATLSVALHRANSKRSPSNLIHKILCGSVQLNMNIEQTRILFWRLNTIRPLFGIHPITFRILLN